MLGGIIITGDPNHPDPESGVSKGTCSPAWARVDVLGKPPIARVADSLRRVCDHVSVVALDNSRLTTDSHNSFCPDVVAKCFANYKRKGFAAVLMIRCGAYVEVDIAEMLAFHELQGLGTTQAFTDEGPLEVWIVDTSAVHECPKILSSAVPLARYYSQAYVNRLQSAEDFRRLVLDSFSSRCLLRPEGIEIKPGVWVGSGAQIDRSARVVAPAFIGRNVEISDNCLITRASNIESNSHIDFGSAIENSSILSNTYVGIGLDLCHSIVDGNNLLNLRHHVNLPITDPVVLRRNEANAIQNQSWMDIESGEMALSSAE